jgi:hypothetical protein
MKTLDRVFIIAGLISLSFLVGISSCDDNGKNENQDKPTKQNTETSLTQQAWKVTNFFDEKDETSLFAGYTFQFNRDGSLIASNSSATVTGTWSIFNSSSGQVKLNLEFSLTEPFDELTDDWEIVESTDNKIMIQHVSGGSGEIDKLTFEKV